MFPPKFMTKANDQMSFGSSHSNPTAARAMQPVQNTREHTHTHTLIYYLIKSLDLCLQKERDLELAARIGQSLLKKNKTLSDRNELLEEQVEHIREEVRRTRPPLCDSFIKRVFSKDPAVHHRLMVLKL